MIMGVSSIVLALPAHRVVAFLTEASVFLVHLQAQVPWIHVRLTSVIDRAAQT